MRSDTIRKRLLPQKRERLRVLAGRMERRDMESLISRENISTVVDATHPYADKASDNIRGAAEATGATYIRLLRGSSKTGDGHMLAPDVKSAVECLKGTEGNVLLTIEEARSWQRLRSLKDFPNACTQGYCLSRE